MFDLIKSKIDAAASSGKRVLSRVTDYYSFRRHVFAGCLISQGKLEDSARCLRDIIGTYSHHEYPIAPIVFSDRKKVIKTAMGVFDNAKRYTNKDYFGNEFLWSIDHLSKGFPLYFSTISPLEKKLSIRAGELAAGKLIKLQENATFQEKFKAVAETAFNGLKADARYALLWEFPGTEKAQTILTQLMQASAKTDDALNRKKLWDLSDIARVNRLKIPAGLKAKVLAPKKEQATVSLLSSQTQTEHKYSDEDETKPTG